MTKYSGNVIDSGETITLNPGDSAANIVINQGGCLFFSGGAATNVAVYSDEGLEYGGGCGGYGVKISMDGRARCLDNAKMERFWWALTYEGIKIKEYVSLPQLRFGVQHYVNFYNTKRIHSALRYQTPDEVYFGTCNPQTKGYGKSKVFTPIFQ